MPHCRPEDIPSPATRGWPWAEGAFRAVEWGGLEMCYTTIDEPTDCSEMFEVGGARDGVCPCPHWFYIFEGRIRSVYPGTDMPDEVASAGEICYFPAGHVLIYEAPSRVLEVNHPAELAECMDAMGRMVAAQEAGGA